jgi:hypothetical protein
MKKGRAVGAWARAGFVGVSMALGVAACGNESKTPEAFHDALACQPGETATPVDNIQVDSSPMSPPGALSDLATKGQALYDQQQWNDAIPILQRVARGEGQDDNANRSIAQYELAVAYYHAHRADLSLEELKPIALNPSNPRHREALVWLGNLSFIQSLGAAPVDYVYLYDDADIAPYDTPEHRELGYLLYYLRGRAAFRRGMYAEAIQKMAVVRRYEPYQKLADGCARLAADAEKGNGPVPPPGYVGGAD